MTHLLDTNAVISVLEAAPGTRFAGVPTSASTHLSIVTVVELTHGVEAAREKASPDLALRENQRLFATGQWRPIPVDLQVALAFGQVARSALGAEQHPRKRMNDLMIAATALAHGLVLVTDDEALTRAVEPLVPVTTLR